ncbi:MAG: ketoacyl-ACP synthase III [Thermoguttaceae bacterium]|nr:ketoacyl-ACP synthase III [Thermoguttaceae bacterium]
MPSSSQIRAISYYVPQRTLDNEELIAKFSGWTAEKMERKLGIVSRPIAAPGETATDMAVSASRNLLDSGIIDPASIDFLVFCTQSPDYFLPTGACLLQDRLGLPKRCGAFDINLGCSGYVYGLAIVKGLIDSGLARRVLFVTSETYSKYINEMDRASRPLFGDAATATLIEGIPTASDTEVSIGPFRFGTDGSGADLLIVPAGAHRTPPTNETKKVLPDMRGNFRSQEQLMMNGPGIFSFAVEEVPPLVEALEEECRQKNLPIDTYIFHQANRYMLSRLQDLCHLEGARYFSNILTRGNSVSSSIPLAIHDAVTEGFIHPGESALLVGFGVGLSWAGCRVRLPEDFKAL